jgi:hypothetical protein
VRDAFGTIDRPLHRLHSAETAADDRGPFLDAECIGQHRLGGHPVANRDGRKVGAVHTARFRIDRTRSGAAVAAAEIVEAHDEEQVRVDGFARADRRVPPTRTIILGAVIAGRVMMSGKRVADQNRVRSRGIQLAVRFIDQFHAGQHAAAQQSDGRVEGLQARCDQAYGVGGDAV